MAALAGPLLLVGCGKMGGALLRGWLSRGLPPRDVVVVEPDAASRERVREEAGVIAVAEPKSLPGDLQPRALVFAIKRFHQPEWGDDWESHFGVDFVNGSLGHELKLHDRKLVGTYLRVGYTPANHWRLFKVRQDFAAAFKVQTEDDITASTVVPATSPDPEREPRTDRNPGGR